MFSVSMSVCVSLFPRLDGSVHDFFATYSELADLKACQMDNARRAENFSGKTKTKDNSVCLDALWRRFRSLVGDII